MKTVNVKDVKGVRFNGGYSFRTVLEKDKLGFAMMETRIEKGSHKWHYKHHQEACMCISGTAYLEDLTTGEISRIEKGVTYLVDDFQPHIFHAETDVVLVSVFNPPLTGNETHDEDGSYAPSEEKKNYAKAKKIVDLINNTNNNYDAIEAIINLI